MFDFANCFDSLIWGVSDRKPFQSIGLNQQKQHQRTQMGQRWRTHLSNLAQWLLTRPKGQLSGGCAPRFNPRPSPLAALPLTPICTSLFLLHWEPPWCKSSRQVSYQDASKVNENVFFFAKETFSLLPRAEITNFKNNSFGGGIPWIFATGTGREVAKQGRIAHLRHD